MFGACEYFASGLGQDSRSATKTAAASLTASRRPARCRHDASCRHRAGRRDAVRLAAAVFVALLLSWPRPLAKYSHAPNIRSVQTLINSPDTEASSRPPRLFSAPRCADSVVSGRTQRSGGQRRRRPVAVQGALPIRAGRGDSPVRVQGDLPAPAMHRDEMVKPAEQDHIAQAGGAALAARLDVVHLARGGWLPAAG